MSGQSLKWRIIFFKDFHTILDSFLCQHEKLHVSSIVGIALVPFYPQVDRMFCLFFLLRFYGFPKKAELP